MFENILKMKKMEQFTADIIELAINEAVSTGFEFAPTDEIKSLQIRALCHKAEMQNGKGFKFLKQEVITDDDRNKLLIDDDNSIYRSAIFAKSFDTKALEYIKSFKFMTASNQNLILTGSTGVGKDWAIICLLSEICEVYNHPVTGKIVNAVSIDVRTASNIFSRFGTATEQQRLLTVSHLHIRDLGAEKDKYWTASLAWIIEYRTERTDKRTYLTTNMNTEEFVNYLDDRSLSRIKKKGQIYVVKDKDYREQERKQDEL